VLKVDFHTHTAEDRRDFVPFTARDLIDRAAEVGFDALAFAFHDQFFRRPALDAYAERKGILLLPGIEITLSRALGGGHIVVINPRFAPRPKGGYALADLRDLRSEDSLFIAAHPHFPGSHSLGPTLVPLLPWIDAIEFTTLHNSVVDFNRRAVRTARLFGKPLVGDSDCHRLALFGKTYTLVAAEKSLPSIVRAVRAGRCEVRTEPIPLTTIALLLAHAITVEKARRVIDNRW